MSALLDARMADSERKRRHEAYLIASEPIVREMAKLKAIYATPWIIVSRDNRRVIDSGEDWTDDEARRLYEKYEETLRVVLKICMTTETL